MYLKLYIQFVCDCVFVCNCLCVCYCVFAIFDFVMCLFLICLWLSLFVTVCLFVSVCVFVTVYVLVTVCVCICDYVFVCDCVWQDRIAHVKIKIANTVKDGEERSIRIKDVWSEKCCLYLDVWYTATNPQPRDKKNAVMMFARDCEETNAYNICCAIPM